MKKKKDNKAHFKHWKVKASGRSDGVRSAVKNLKSKREESELIAEQTKAFLENGGKIEVHEQDFCTDISKVAYGYQKTTY
tara:strand:- start:523 stop:762 length:240 start_codon:yes stop_codon:yes gene_type:complete